MAKMLSRSREDRILAGICGGLGEYLEFDPVIIRVAFVVAGFIGGSGVVLYALLWLVIPEASKGKTKPRSILQELIEQNMEKKEETAKKAETKASQEEAAESDWKETVAEEVTELKKEWKRRESDGRGSLVGGLVLLTLGVLFLAQNFLDFDFGKLWPVLLVVIGLGILIKSVGRRS